jgi:Methyltransferase small domain
MPQRVPRAWQRAQGSKVRQVFSCVRLTLNAMRVNVVRGWQETADFRSFLRWLVDLLLYRLMAVAPIARERVRTIRLKPHVTLAYRRTRSDFRTVGETWLTRTYELPFSIERPSLIVDLGANIGVTAIWLARRYGCDRLVAVEPVPANVALARRNLAANGLPFELHEAAVAATNGTGHFEDSGESTTGRLEPRAEWCGSSQCPS